MAEQIERGAASAASRIRRGLFLSDLPSAEWVTYVREIEAAAFRGDTYRERLLEYEAGRRVASLEEDAPVGPYPESETHGDPDDEQ